MIRVLRDFADAVRKTSEEYEKLSNNETQDPTPFTRSIIHQHIILGETYVLLMKDLSRLIGSHRPSSDEDSGRQVERVDVS